ncbi:coenzyme F420-0:L-glutamate ligase [Candidatus Uhrbacteria bacterium]|nr:coenzyme F420-0:L-glutamate ligase [Candidatus Uhrbacteria bacterium]
MQILAVSTKLFHEGDNLLSFLIAFLPQLQEKDIVVVTSKIIALSESRTRENPTLEIKKHIARTESEESVETPWCTLTRKGNDWSANAGIDESNAQGKLILLPKNPKQTTIELQQQLKNHYRIKELGIIMCDTRLVPLRTGTLGIALAWSGIEPLTDYRGTKDLYGRELKMTQANIVHALATSAVLCMGEGAEQKPLALIQQAPVVFSKTSGEITDLSVLPEHDLYGYVYAKHPTEPPKPQVPATF